jgi:peptidyl-Lys metalloendopeptidase
MNRTISTGLSPSRIFGSALALAALSFGAYETAIATTPRPPINPVRVSVQALGRDQVEVVLTNTSQKTLRIPKWQLPSEPIDSNLFRISHEGKNVRFHGRIVNRTTPTISDFAVLRPGQTHRSIVDLGKAYDLSRPGLYTVTFKTHLQHASLSGRKRLRESNGSPMIAQAAPILIFLERATTRPRIKPVLPSNPTLSDELGFATNTCNADQVQKINQAVLSARSLAHEARLYLNFDVPTPTYTDWFGNWTTQRYGTVANNFIAINSAIKRVSGEITIHCGCTENFFAYVYKDQPYNIWVCNEFWNAPLVGADSKAGTLIHEMSHFSNVADTYDHVYGQAAARNLAYTNPGLAIENADNYEYFAEELTYLLR